ncbi:hypothetical protein [uncultured Mediterranean phage uvMED]|nr:hypothetical protein [uncultured Mediterranean phage uvMED]BAQ86766.1 hypothetical protein [uncultured Mediterranean phage uvMED]
MKKQSKEQMLSELLNVAWKKTDVVNKALNSEVTWDYADGYNQAVEDIAKAIDIKMKEVSNV